MKKLLIILIIAFTACNAPVEQKTVTSEYPKTFKLRTIGDKVYSIELGSDGHEYIQNTHDYTLLHSPECNKCQTKFTVPQFTSKVDTVFIPKDTLVQKSIKLLCVSASSILQQGKIHQATSDLFEGTLYKTIAKPYASPETGDSVYYIDGVGEKLTHRFVKPL